jgi:hypothetical protein
MNIYGEVELYLRTFLTSALDAGEWSYKSKGEGKVVPVLFFN